MFDVAKTPLADLFRLSPAQKSAVEKLGIETVGNLLYHFPHRHRKRAVAGHIHNLAPGETASVTGIIRKIKIGKTFRTKIPVAEATLDDGTGTIALIWFHQPYIAKKFREGETISASGKVSIRGKTFAMANPEVEPVGNSLLRAGAFGTNSGSPRASDSLAPVYPESRGITSLWFYYAIQKIIARGFIDCIEDPLPHEILKKYHLPSLKTALVWIHAPQKESDARAARKRFAFEEIFLIQITKQRERHTSDQSASFRIAQANRESKEFTDRFPFALTRAQERAIRVILDDFASGRPMSRLLEGDVGSGKTAVAAATAYAVAASRPARQNFGNLQVAYMAPTEILAKQLFNSFIEYFGHLPIPIGLLTASGCRKFPSKTERSATAISRSQLLKWVANGEIPILVGTHALIQKSVVFKNLAYVIIDEQHRFGTLQRQKLARKGDAIPHLLSMTATPIPRTLALTIYGDLDLTLLNEMPPGRKRVETDIILPHERNTMYERVRKEIAWGRQVYIICPRIDEPDPEKEFALNAKSAKEEAERLARDVFPEYSVGLIHSKLTPREKDTVMRRFAEREIAVLVATSVVEVGVNVPNATVIVVEGAERFGLAQLHQLRGRVLRSADQAYCFLVTESRSLKAIKRLRVLVSAKNGFELAELDLALRGSGDLSGRHQWGISDVGMEALANIKMVEAAREEARKIIAEDPSLDAYPLLQQKVEQKKESFHFE